VVLRNIFGPQGEEVRRKWRKLHNEEFNKLTTHYILLGDHMKNDEKAGASTRVKNCVCKLSVGKSEGKRRFGNCRFR
jgi:hypothetical protein